MDFKEVSSEFEDVSGGMEKGDVKTSDELPSNVLLDAKNKFDEIKNDKTCCGRMTYYSLVFFYYCVHILSPILQFLIVAESVALTQFSIFLRTNGNIYEALKVSIVVGFIVSLILCVFSFVRMRMESVHDSVYSDADILLFMSNDISFFSFVEFVFYVILVNILSIAAAVIQQPCTSNDYVCVFLMQYIKGA